MAAARREEKPQEYRDAPPIPRLAQECAPAHNAAAPLRLLGGQSAKWSIPPRILPTTALGASSHGFLRCAPPAIATAGSVLPGGGRGITEESTTDTQNSPSPPKCVSQCGTRGVCMSNAEKPSRFEERIVHVDTYLRSLMDASFQIAGRTPPDACLYCGFGRLLC